MWSLVRKFFAGRQDRTEEQEVRYVPKYTPPPDTPKQDRISPYRGGTKRRAEGPADNRHNKKREMPEQSSSSKVGAKPSTGSKASNERDNTGRGALKMPPPATPRSRTKLGRSQNQSIGHIEETQSNFSFATSTKRPILADDDQFAMEQARRHAAATQLPAGTGVWAVSEKNLFYHLALRGFEPLLPHNWMVDFKTLPLSLFSHDDTHNSKPLLEPLHTTEFRAIRALRELMNTGKDVRDRSLSSPGSHAETTIHRALDKFFNLCTLDANVPSATVPIHTIVTRRKGQDTQQILAELNRSLHDLAAYHRESLHIAESIETPSQEAFGIHHSSDAPIYDETNLANADIPVLIGIVVVSSLVILFTLNGYSAQPRVIGVEGLGIVDRSDNVDSQDSGIKYIAQFDFSDPGQDVWNALAVAIIGMQIRDTLVRCKTDEEDDDADDEATKVDGAKNGVAAVLSVLKGKGKVVFRDDDRTDQEDEEAEDEDDPDK